MVLAVLTLAAALTLAGCGTLAPADPQGAHVTRVTIVSRAVGRTEHVTVVVPAGRAPGVAWPLLVFLHGRGGDGRSEMSNAPMFAELRRLGSHAPIVAFPDGGDHSYWHRRQGGDWARYVADEVIPLVARRFHADPRRVAIGGISMGGFGAVDLAERMPGRWCAVGAHSPALWQQADQTAPGAFDDAQDFAAHDVIATAATQAGESALATQPLWLDAGQSDPFLPGDRALVAALHAAGDEAVRLNTRPGGHDGDYWRSRWPEYLRFYAAALARCA